LLLLRDDSRLSNMKAAAQADAGQFDIAMTIEKLQNCYQTIL